MHNQPQPTGDLVKLDLIQHFPPILALQTYHWTECYGIPDRCVSNDTPSRIIAELLGLLRSYCGVSKRFVTNEPEFEYVSLD